MSCISCGRFNLKFGDKTLVMGILNLTPDSFYNSSGHISTEQSISLAEKLVEEGADILDAGGESTRPGSSPVNAQEEIKRIVPVIKHLAKTIDIPISVDTYKAEVAKAALDAGASIINDISGFRFDPEMPGVAALYGIPVVLMHTKGRPSHMQKNIHYNDLMAEIRIYLSESIMIGKNAGIGEDKFIIDPGIGFGKEPEHNYRILAHLSVLKDIGCPILIGPSRKSFLAKELNLSPEERMEGTAAAVTAGILNGANIIRVHDVGAMKRVAAVADAVKLEI